MKKYLLILLSCLFINFGYSQEIPKANVVTTVSREDLKKTLEHIVRLSKAQAEELDKAKSEAEMLKYELSIAERSTKTAQTSADIFQREVNELTEDRNNQVLEKNKAIDSTNKYKVLYEETASKLSFWRWLFGGIISLLTIGGLAWGALKFGFLKI